MIPLLSYGHNVTDTVSTVSFKCIIFFHTFHGDSKEKAYERIGSA